MSYLGVSGIALKNELYIMPQQYHQKAVVQLAKSQRLAQPTRAAAQVNWWIGGGLPCLHAFKLQHKARA